MKLLEKIKNSETVQRLGSETSPYFKPIQKVGAGIVIAGLAIKIAAVCFPATMPIGIISLVPEMISIGMTLAGVATLTKKH